MSKGLSYLLYFFSLIAAYMEYWLFSLLSTITFISFLSFIASALHFGISSWLFLFLNKSGRVLALTTGSLMMIWPLQIIINSLNDREYSLLFYYLIPVVLSLTTIIIHILHLTKPAVMGKFSRYFMAAIPLLLFLIYVWSITMESIREGALNIVF